jgi:glutathione synthase/RimK-type ligase-like ATP-grasp enzyme
MILIVGHHADPHVAKVVDCLERNKSRYSILDAFEFSSGGLHLNLSSGLDVALGQSKHRLEDFSAIWWRQKPKFRIPTETATALYDYNFLHREWNHVLDCIASETTHLFSINNRAKASAAENKVVQLKLAISCGLSIPETLVTNDPTAAITFLSAFENRRYVYKPLTPYMAPTGTLTYTTLINSTMLRERGDSVRAAPGIFQVFVEKSFELRITVVGDAIFAARIHSHYSEDSAIDWRREIFADIYSRFSLESGFHEKLINFHHKLGLFFAAYDFVVDRAGELYLLDVNPAGQWMWLEEKLGFPISEEIATALSNRVG